MRDKGQQKRKERQKFGRKKLNMLLIQVTPV